jgi:hypothetical protein
LKVFQNMSKIYFCKNILNGNICGITDPENFEIKRYSICKSCRIKKINEKKKEKKQEELDERLKSIDPNKDFQLLFDKQKVVSDKSTRELFKHIIVENKKLKEEIMEMRNKYNKVILDIYNNIELLKLRLPHSK